MLTKDELDYLSKIPKNKKVSVKPFDPQAKKVGDSIVSKIKKALPSLEVLFMGATALGTAGQNDIDLYVLVDSKDFDEYLPTIKNLFGKPRSIHKKFVEWSFMKDGYQIEFYMADPNSPSMRKQIRVFNVLKTSPRLLKEYEKLKLSFDGKYFRDYQRAKYEFYNKV